MAQNNLCHAVLDIAEIKPVISVFKRFPGPYIRIMSCKHNFLIVCLEIFPIAQTVDRA